MEETKFILVIVEGNSDEALIGEYCDFFDSKSKNINVRCEVTNGDILPEIKTKKSGEKLVTELFNDYLQRSSLKKNDFIQIVQICDIDGSYFPLDKIIGDPNFGDYFKPNYSYAPGQEKIFVNDKKRDRLLKSWSEKRRRQEELSQINDIKGIPFSIYYNSFFLEHVLGGPVDIIDDEKENILDNFIWKNNHKEIGNFFKSKRLADNYSESWEKLIEEDFTKFAACSNVFFMFEKLEAIFSK